MAKHAKVPGTTRAAQAAPMRVLNVPLLGVKVDVIERDGDAEPRFELVVGPMPVRFVLPLSSGAAAEIAESLTADEKAVRVYGPGDMPR